MEKRCFKCGEMKPLEQFYRHPMMGDGRLGKCKECTKMDVRINYHQRREQYLAYDRQRNQLPHRIAANKAKAKTESGKISHKIACKRWDVQYPERKRAHGKVHYAIRSGRLVPQPCVQCGEKAQAHHEDYSKPLDVVWLCPAHHTARHDEIRASKSA